MHRLLIILGVIPMILGYAKEGRLAGKVALVTGAAQGIGKETAFVLAREGAHIIVADVNDAGGKEVAKQIKGSAHYVHLDVRSEQDWQIAMKEIIEIFSKLDILVNNAGIHGGYQDPENGTLEGWREVQAVNSEGVFLGCKYAIQTMKMTSHEASIINIASAAALIGFPGSVPYCASKAAVVNLTKSVAIYCCQQGYNIRCNSILPTFIDTPMVSKIERNKEQAERFQAYIKGTPMGKMGMPEDIANAVVFLASNESKYITGTELLIDGGTRGAWSGMPLNKKSYLCDN